MTCNGSPEQLLRVLGALQRVLGAHDVERGGEDVVLVACSGGLDSVALAHGAATLLGGRRVVLGHVDHAVRPYSTLDAATVRALAAHLGAAFRMTRLPLGPATEARLREARYAALEGQRQAVGARFILTAHSQDDQAETVLMAVLRSADVRALQGIPPVRGPILRPLLSVPRADLAAYVDRHHLTFREDPTNREPRYLRNRIRKELLPLIERRYRPRIAHRLAGWATQLQSGAQEQLSSDGIRPPTARPERDPMFGSAWLDGRLWLKMERRPWMGGPPPDGTMVAGFDAEHLDAPRIRLLRLGDRIRPFGMDGHRKVRDLLRERGVTAADRPVLPLVVDEADRVLWVPGVRRSAWAPITGTTRVVWWFSIGQDHELQARESRSTLDGATAGNT